MNYIQCIAICYFALWILPLFCTKYLTPFTVSDGMVHSRYEPWKKGAGYEVCIGPDTWNGCPPSHCWNQSFENIWKQKVQTCKQCNVIKATEPLKYLKCFPLKSTYV